MISSVLDVVLNDENQTISSLEVEQAVDLPHLSQLLRRLGDGQLENPVNHQLLHLSEGVLKPINFQLAVRSHTEEQIQPDILSIIELRGWSSLLLFSWNLGETLTSLQPLLQSIENCRGDGGEHRVILLD